MTTKELELWKGKFGDDYTDRNEFGDNEIQARMAMWNVIGTIIGEPINSLLEVGAGAGVNLVAINKLVNLDDPPRKIDLYALEPNNKAKEILLKQDTGPLTIVGRHALDIYLGDSSVDLVYTSGVLIHINPDNLLEAMKEIYRVSKKYIVCIEYFSAMPRKISYRGEQSALWAQDFGSLWLDNFALMCKGCGFMWKRISGLDNLTYWVFEKVN